jgi:predicted dehydrogenase
MSDGPIKTAILGLGRSGWNIHIAGIRNDPRYKVVSVMDPSAERRAQAKDELGADGYEDLDSLLAGTDAELVVVATPSVVHGPQTIAALESGRDVVVEKPMSSSVAEADAMIAAADDAGKNLMIHQNYRYHKSFTFMKDLVASGKLGPLVHFGYVSHGYSRRNDWQTLRKYSGGLLNNKITHPLDQILTIVDSPVNQVLADLKHISDAGDVEDHVKILMRADNGVTIELDDSTSAATTDHAPNWTILGRYGACTIRGGKAHLKYYDPKEAPPIEVVDNTAVGGRKYGNADSLPWKEEKDVEAIGHDPGSFYDAVHRTLRGGKPFEIRPESVRNMMALLDEFRRQNPDFPGK